MTPQATVTEKPYPPSFVDRLMDAVKRLPIPYGVTYLALFILMALLNHVLSWLDGWLPVLSFSSLVLLYPLWFAFPLAVMTYLNSVSREALSDFGPLLDIPNETMRQLEYEFTTMPQRGVILSGVFWTISYLIIIYFALDMFASLGFGILVLSFFLVQGLLVFAVGSAIYYHSLRQLRLVNKTVNSAKQFNLFRLDPVYAFSALTSRTGIAWVLLLTLSFIVFPIQFAPVPALTLLVLQVLFATAAFILPLRIVNQRLVAEKRRLLAEHAQRVEKTLVELNRSIDDKAMAEVGELTTLISGLDAERTILDQLPTWPWRAGVLTGFLSIVVLPIILFLVQLVLGNLLSQ